MNLFVKDAFREEVEFQSPNLDHRLLQTYLDNGLIHYITKCVPLFILIRIFFEKGEDPKRVIYGSPPKISDLCKSTYNESVNKMKCQSRKDTMLPAAPSCWPFPLFCKVLKLVISSNQEEKKTSQGYWVTELHNATNYNPRVWLERAVFL